MALPWISASHGELFFWCTDTSASWNEAFSTVIFMLEIHVYFCTGTLMYLQVHGTCFHSYILHFLSYHTVGHKLVAMTYGRPICMYVSKYVSACVYQPCPRSLPGQIWITFCLQLWIPNPQHGTVHWLSSSVLQYFNSSVLGMSCLHLLSYVDSLTHLAQNDYA